jgi:hypothetical protein
MVRAAKLIAQVNGSERDQPVVIRLCPELQARSADPDVAVQQSLERGVNLQAPIS